MAGRRAHAGLEPGRSARAASSAPRDACAIVNTDTISTSWAGNISSPYFFEGGLNLSALFPQAVPCFSTFLTNTRTSQSESAQLKDFALGDIDTCGSIEITKVATAE